MLEFQKFERKSFKNKKIKSSICRISCIHRLTGYYYIPLVNLRTYQRQVVLLVVGKDSRIFSILMDNGGWRRDGG